MTPDQDTSHWQHYCVEDHQRFGSGLCFIAAQYQNHWTASRPPEVLYSGLFQSSVLDDGSGTKHTQKTASPTTCSAPHSVRLCRTTEDEAACLSSSSRLHAHPPPRTPTLEPGAVGWEDGCFPLRLTAAHSTTVCVFMSVCACGAVALVGVFSARLGIYSGGETFEKLSSACRHDRRCGCGCLASALIQQAQDTTAAHRVINKNTIAVLHEQFTSRHGNTAVFYFNSEIFSWRARPLVSLSLHSTRTGLRPCQHCNDTMKTEKLSFQSVGDTQIANQIFFFVVLFSKHGLQ